MNSNDLTQTQAKKMHAALAPTLTYLSRLTRRLNDKSFPPNDPLYRAAFKAHGAMSELVMTLHYLTCSGTGTARQG